MGTKLSTSSRQSVSAQLERAKQQRRVEIASTAETQALLKDEAGAQWLVTFDKNGKVKSVENANGSPATRK